MGLRRQEHLFEAFCERHGFVPDNDRLMEKDSSLITGSIIRKEAWALFFRPVAMA